MSTLYLDLETYSSIDLGKAGTYRYAEAAEILLFAYALDDNPVEVWDCVEFPFAPKQLLNALMNADSVCAHNSIFDRVLLSKLFPALVTKPWRDTSIRALAHGLPGGLGKLSEIFNLPIDKAKDKAGRKLIQLFCKPQKKRDGSTFRATAKTHPKEWEEFKAYAALDIEAMRALDGKIPRWNDTAEERNLWYLDQKINDRGFMVDTDLAQKAIDAVVAERKILDSQTQMLTNGAVNAATQRDALLRHILEEYGVSLPDMTESTLERRLEDPELPDPVKELIALRLQSAGTSTRKYKTLLDAVSSDGRLRGALQFCGAPRTGRWSGRKFQPQNLPRPTLKQKEIDLGIKALKADCAELIWDNVADVASQCIRGSIIAPKGKKLVVADLKSIEGRMLAWLAGEEWKLDAYRDLDLGISSYDMYVLTYSKTFNVDPSTADKTQRQLGKVLELALGYGGGVGAFITFSQGYSIDLDALAAQVWDALEDWAIQDARYYWTKAEKKYGLEEKTFVACDAIKRMWRKANAKIEDLWATLEHDVRNCLKYGYATERRTYKVDKKGKWLRVHLPSGRVLCYAGAALDDEGKISYLGINQYSRKWGRLNTYGGKLVENLTQAASRDILANGMTLAEGAGYEVVLSVHDELITEASDTPEYNAEKLSKIMSSVPSWANGLPLGAEGFESYRYRKG